MLNRDTVFRPIRSAGSLLRLQRQYGNRYVQRMLAVARRSEGQAEAAPDVEHAIQQTRGGGQALDSGVRAQMEPAFGADFSGVRVHTNAQADALSQAKADADRWPVVQRRQATTSLHRQPETPEWKKREKRFKLLLGDLKPKDPKSNMDKFKTGLDKLLLTLGHEKTAKDLTPKLGLTPKGQLLWQIVTRTGASLWLMQQGKLPNVIPDIPLSDDLMLDANLEGTFEKPRFMLYLKWRF